MTGGLGLQTATATARSQPRAARTASAVRMACQGEVEGKSGVAGAVCGLIIMPAIILLTAAGRRDFVDGDAAGRQL
jgi:hypothetical protein